MARDKKTPRVEERQLEGVKHDGRYWVVITSTPSGREREEGPFWVEEMAKKACREGGLQ